ncbi:MAG: hypothetical protein WCY32_03160 [Burkholderiaceae bacterium]
MNLNPVLDAVARLLDAAPGAPGGVPVTELAETLADEPRLRIATRLALVDLAARCAQSDPHSLEDTYPCTLCPPMIARRLARLSGASEENALAGLAELAPQLRDLAASLRQDHQALAILPQALLELLQTRLH